MIVGLFIAMALLTAPVPIAPPDDPDFASCVAPGDGVPLRWRYQDSSSLYLLVKRRNGEQWKTWLKTYVKGPPFVLNMRSQQARNGQFAWMLLTVDHGAQSFYPSEWHYFCTMDDDSHQ